MFRFFLFSLLLFPCFHGTASALTVDFVKDTEVTTPYITLLDIATLNEDSAIADALASKHIGNSPKPGVSIDISSRTIKEKLLRLLPQDTAISWKGASTITVHRQGITVDASAIQATINTFLLEMQSGQHDVSYSFTPREHPLPFVLPTGEMEIEIIPANPDLIGSRRITLIYTVDDKIVKNISIRGKLNATAMVAVLTQNVKRGSILEPGMVTLENKDLAKLRTPCMNLRNVIGKKVTRTLRKGRVLDISSIEFPPLIQKGEFVKIHIKHNGMHLSATGVSSMNGKQDQIIRVVNSRSRKTIFCKVTAPGIVEVQI